MIRTAKITMGRCTGPPGWGCRAGGLMGGGILADGSSDLAGCLTGVGGGVAVAFLVMISLEQMPEDAAPLGWTMANTTTANRDV